MSDKFELINAPPIAINLISSLRSMGYTLEASVSDLIDNSIAAEATIINLQFNWDNGKASFCISDNGKGMSEQTLINAMTFASSNVSDNRTENDLGRFGLGLKSASLAQCKVLKVVSKEADGPINTLLWDLNELEKSSSNNWSLIKPLLTENEDSTALINTKGTIVFWSDMDAIYNVGVGESEFLDLVDNVESHIARTFHRFLEDELTLTINGKRVLPSSPVTPQKASYISPTENLGSSVMPVELKAYGYELSQKETSNFGTYYIYRGSRVICSGKIKELIQLDVRNINLTIDITNTLDFTWSIDISKTKAMPPKGVIPKIKEFVFWVLEKAPKAKTKTLKPLDGNQKEIWLVKDGERRAPLVINRNHHLIEKVLSLLTDENSKHFQNLLKTLERDVPTHVEVVYEKKINEKEHSSPITEQGMKDIKIHLLRLTKIKKMPLELAKKKLKQDSIFSQYDEVIDQVASSLKEEI